MKEAISSPYAKLVFRETFNDEQSVRSNGGVPTAVTFSNGVGSFNGTTNIISYNSCSNHYPVNTGLSIRIIFELTNLTWNSNNYAVTQYDAGSNNRSWAVSFDANGFLVFRYSVNGSSVSTAQSTVNLKALELNKTYEVMIVTRLGYVGFYLNGILMDSQIFNNNCFITNTPLTIGGTNTPSFSHKLGLIEIYQGTLTDSEVKNLYDNDWNKEFISSNLLLDYDATNGYITDRTGKNILTLSGIESINIIKNGSYSALKTSAGFKQVLDSNIINEQSITVVYWANYNSVSVGKYVMDNGTFFIDGSTLNRIRVRSDGSSSGISASNFITIGKTQFIAITRASDGTVTFYRGDLQNAPVSSGTANSGTPAATSTPLTLLGLTNSNSSGFDGKMMMIKVFDGILSLEDITQIWSSTRGKVN